MRRLKKVTADVVTRKIPETLTVRTLFGEVLIKKPCPCCNKLRYKFEFYLKAKETDLVRYQCVDCWDEHNGRNPNKKKKEKFATLDEFLKEDDNA